MTEEVIIKVGTTGEDSVDKLDKGLNKLGGTTKRTLSEFQKLSREIREAKGEMLKHAEGTAEYNKALLKASEGQRRLKEANDVVRAGVRDMGETSKLVAGTMTGLASGFQVAQGAMALFGVENDMVLQTMMKMQAVMSITQGISGFANGLDNLQDLMIGFRAEANGAGDAVNELSKASGEAAGSMGNVAKEGAVIGSNLAGVNSITKQTNDGFNKMTEATKAFTDSIQNNDALKKLQNEYQLLEKQQRIVGASPEAYARIANEMEDIENQMSDILGNSTEVIQEKLKSTDSLSTGTEKLTDSTKNLEKGTKSATKSMLHSMATMGIWIAIIAAVTYGISWLIEKLNEIPKDLEVKLELNTESLKQTQKVRESIKEIQHEHNMANKARLEGDNKTSAKIITNLKKQLDSIKSGAAKEYELAKDKNKWLTEFAKAENERQRKLAYNKVLWSKQAEAEISIAQEKKTQAEVRASIKSSLLERGKTEEQADNFVKSWEKGWLTYSVVVANGLTGQLKVWNDSIDEIKDIREENKALLSLKPYDIVDFDKTKPSGGGGSGGSKSKPSINTFLDRDVKAELTNIDNFYKPIIDSEIKYTNEELVIMEDNKKKRSVIYDDAIEDKVDYIKRIEEARRKDMSNELTDLYGKKTIIQAEVDRFDKLKSLYEQGVNEVNTYATNKAGIQNKIISLDKELSSLGDKATQKDADRILAKKKIYLDEIDLIDADIKAKNSQIEALKIQLKEAEGYPEKMAQITARIAQLNVAITDSLRVTTDSERLIWDARISMAKDYLDAIGNVAGGLADIAQGNMDLINAEYDRKIWANDEMIQSDKQRADKEYEIEMARWEALQENFEAQKKMKEAQAWMDFASGSVGIWTAPGITSLAPFGYILAGIQQSALLATTVGNVKSIRSQQMLKPHKSNGGSASGSSSALTPALNPVKNALTSRDENLNTMSKANQKDIPTSVVKVSEINDVQGRVRVREENSSY